MAEFCGEAGRKYAYISNWVFLVAGSVGKIFPLSSSQSHISYLCTCNLYSPVRNAFDAGSIHNEGKWEGVGPWKSILFWAL
jgi:hypothetical protein